MNSNDAFQLVTLALVVFAGCRWALSERYIRLPADKFWSFVQSQEKPVVFLTTRGYLLKRLVYLFPYQGVLFVTRAKLTEVPNGVKLIGIGEADGMG